MTFELPIIVLNLVIILLAYLWFYPTSVGNNINKIAWYDCFVSGLALLVVGFKYWGSGQVFSLLGWEMNWFWFTLLSFTLIEIPILLWYFRQYPLEGE
ncbi:hypothetical protein KO495_09175 [Colwellia sp. D2M02]|uniref:hypothetical protein n=1 Tax=Colwellia sp. D2M02 TaxID=2841562 RepID=UPI001C0831CC|nr:hypothetical protein [Colwellia sp. D2M02]MBU2893487.1 hypothetical protein [Colwellia sp. D2M02]